MWMGRLAGVTPRISRIDALVTQPTSGRTFRVRYKVRLSDTDARGRLRLDAIARYLQDAAIDDVDETNWGGPEHLWVLRAVRIDVVAPFLEDTSVDIVTWGSSLSSLAAGRRWSLAGNADGSVEVDSTWIHLDATARPARIGDGFEDYAEAAQGKVSSTKLVLEPPAVGAQRHEWPLRAGDLDRMGHVNNAAYWAAVQHRLVGRAPDLAQPYRARLEYRHPIDLEEHVELVERTSREVYEAAFTVGEVVGAVVRVEPLLTS